MDEPSLRLRQALDKFIKHVDDLIEEEDPAGNGFHREYRVSLTPRTIGDLTVCTCTPHITPEIMVPALEFWKEGSTKVLLSLRGCQLEYVLVCRLVRFVYKEGVCTSYAPFCFFTWSNTHLPRYLQTVKLLLLSIQICTLAKLIYSHHMRYLCKLMG